MSLFPQLKSFRSSSEDILAAHISFSLPEAFVLREQDGINHFCEVRGDMILIVRFVVRFVVE